MSHRPLEGVRVLDFGQVYQGPYATFLMAQAGADVIKIEPPTGEPARRREVIGEGPSYAIAFLASNKRAITLDLKQERGRELLLTLVEKSDVLLENFSPGVMDRLGVGYGALRRHNPRLIYATGTAYGISGPDFDRLGMDITVQAATGIMSITGEPGSGPLKSGPALCDFLGGAHLYGGVVSALLERERTGEGQLIEVSMQEATYPTLLTKLGLMYVMGETPPQWGNAHPMLAPYNVYETSDGHVAIICLTQGHWQALAEAMGKPELGQDARFLTHADRHQNVQELDRLVEAWTRSLPKEQVFEAARQHKIPCSPVRDLEEVNRDPHMHARGYLQQIDHPDLGPSVLPGSAIRFGGDNPPTLEPSPRLGQHNREIYVDWLGLLDEELEQLHRDGVI